jgi:hypothetical protein
MRAGPAPAVAGIYNRARYEAEKREALERWRGTSRTCPGRLPSGCRLVVKCRRKIPPTRVALA